MRPTAPILAAGLILVVTRAFGADVPVTYSVDFRAYKSSVTQGDPLTFALYADNGCTTLLHSQVVNAGPAIRQEKILVQPVKEQAPRPVREMRLHATLSVATLADAIFLKVTGTGVVPIDTACQPQAARAAESGPQLFVRNGNGDVIGTTSTAAASCSASSCVLNFSRTLGTSVRLNCSVTESSGGGTTVSCGPATGSAWTGYYADAGCTQPLLEWPDVYSPANLPANPPPVANAGVRAGKILWSEAPMSAYTSMPVYFFLNPCIAAGTALVITPQVDDPTLLDVPPFTVGS